MNYLKNTIEYTNQFLNEWGAYPILNFKNILNWLPQPIQGKNLTWPNIDVREKTHQIMPHSLANIDAYAYNVRVYANSFA